MKPTIAEDGDPIAIPTVVFLLLCKTTEPVLKHSQDDLLLEYSAPQE